MKKKSVYDSVIETFLNIKGKTKDGVTTRQDLIWLSWVYFLSCIHSGKTILYLPQTCHTLSKKEKSKLLLLFIQCEIVTGVLFKC